MCSRPTQVDPAVAPLHPSPYFVTSTRLYPKPLPISIVAPSSRFSISLLSEAHGISESFLLFCFVAPSWQHLRSCGALLWCRTFWGSGLAAQTGLPHLASRYPRSLPRVVLSLRALLLFCSTCHVPLIYHMQRKSAAVPRPLHCSSPLSLLLSCSHSVLFSLTQTRTRRACLQL